MSKGRVLEQHHHGMTHVLQVLAIVMTLVAGSLVMSAGSASADRKPAPSVVDAETLTPHQLSGQIKAAEALRADLMKTSAKVAAANTRLERLSVQANRLLATLSAARTAQAAAEADALAQRSHLLMLGIQVESALDALGRLASDSYIRGGGPLGDIVAILQALTAPSADQNSDSMATVQYLIDARARLFERLEVLHSDQVVTSARAETASELATAAATQAAQAKAKLDLVIVQQRSALEALQNAQADQVGRAAGLRGALLRSESQIARAADRRLANALQGQDFKLLMDDSSDCGKGAKNYPNGRFPGSALCPLYAAPDEGLPREPAMAFNAMSHAYEEQTGSPLCVTDAYRSLPEQVAVKLASPKLAATPGTSQHGLGLAVDLCGGVQSFASPAHLWMQRHAPLYGWFLPAWAEPTGVLPEPWHWEFAN